MEGNPENNPWIELELPIGDTVSAASFSCDNKLALSSWDGLLIIVDCDLACLPEGTSPKCRLVSLPPPLLSVAWADSSNLFACGPAAGLVQITLGPEIAVQQRPLQAQPAAIAFTDSFLCVSAWNKQLIILSRGSYDCVRVISLPDSPIAISSSGDRLVVACQNRYIFAITDSQLQDPNPSPLFIQSPLRHATSAIAAQGDDILLGSLEGRLALVRKGATTCWHGHRRTMTPEQLGQLPPILVPATVRYEDTVAAHPVMACVFAGDSCVTGGCDGAVYLWPPIEGSAPGRICLSPPQRPSVTALAYRAGVLVAAFGDAWEAGCSTDTLPPSVRVLYLVPWIAQKVGRQNLA